MLRLRRLPALLLMLCLALPAMAEEDAAEQVTRRVSLARYRVSPVPAGPRLSVPPDLIATSEEPSESSIWELDTFTDAGTWLPFSSPFLEDAAVSADTVVELVRSSLAHDEALSEGLSIDVDDDTIILVGLDKAVAAAEANLAWILRGLAPSVHVDAVLTQSAGSKGGARLRAMGGVRLFAGRWTRVYLQESHLACTPRWDIELAQEATIMNPGPKQVAEGTELYVRYQPGETASIVEVWAGDVEHIEVIRDDLSGVRNVPEANGLGVVTYPRSAVNRVFTQLLLPTGEAARREVRWHNEGRDMRLQLRVEPPRRAAPRLDRGDRNALGFFRAGALSAAFEYDARSASVDLWNERVSRSLYQAAEAHEAQGHTFEFNVSPVDGGAVLFVDAPAAEMAKARALLARAEQRLSQRTLSLQVLVAPETAWRDAVVNGTVRMGRAVPAAVMEALQEAGARQAEAFRAPALAGAALGFRAGHSRPGILDYDAEVSQQAAGLYPRTSARFAGLFGELRLRAAENGWAVRLRGGYSWASSQVGGVEITMRDPISMQGSKTPKKDANPRSRLVRLPILTGGHAPIDREVEVGAEAAPDVLMHAHVRGDEVIVVLLSVEAD